MFSTIALIISVVGFISDASGFVRERRSAYEAALKWSKTGWNADISELQKEGSGSPPDKAELLEAACIYSRVWTGTVYPPTFSSRFSWSM